MHTNKTVAGHMHGAWQRRTTHDWRGHTDKDGDAEPSVPGGTTSNTHEEDCDDNAHKDEYEKDSNMT